MSKMMIQKIVLGPVATNCFLIKNTQTNEMIIVDPPAKAGEIAKAITVMNGQPTGILLTHGHFDHICAVNELKDIYDNLKVYAYVKEKEVLEDPMLNLSGSWMSAYTTKADELLVDEQVFTLAGFEIKVLHTPGHTQGSCCYYFAGEDVLISGDTLFAGSCGRTDFPTSSFTQMRASLRKLFDTLPEDTLVYPGHEQSTTIGYEKRYNPFA